MMGMWGSSRAIKFEARVCIRALHALPYHNAVVFCRVKHKGTPYLTSRASARFNMVRWDETISFPVKTKVKKSGTVARDDVTITVFREAKGGRNSKQLGEVKINLAEFAGRQNIERKYLLHTSSTSTRSDNSVLQVTISMDFIDGPPIFKAAESTAPLLRSSSFGEADAPRNPADPDSSSYGSSSSSRPVSELGDPSDDLSALFATTAATPLSQQEHAMNS